MVSFQGPLDLSWFGISAEPKKTLYGAMLRATRLRPLARTVLSARCCGDVAVNEANGTDGDPIPTALGSYGSYGSRIWGFTPSWAVDRSPPTKKSWVMVMGPHCDSHYLKFGKFSTSEVPRRKSPVLVKSPVVWNPFSENRWAQVISLSCFSFSPSIYSIYKYKNGSSL